MQSILLPPVTIVVFSKSLQNNDDESHQRLDQAKLEGGLFAEAKEPNGVGLAIEATSAVPAGRANRFPPDLAHDVSLTAEVLVAQAQEVVDYKCCRMTIFLGVNLVE